MNIPYVCIYILWTEHMGYNFPMPFAPLPCGCIAAFSMYITIWFGFSAELRSQEEFRKRLMSLMFYMAIITTIVLHHIILDAILHLLKVYEYENGIQVQWILAFIIPISRGFYESVLPKIINKAAGNENEAASFAMETQIGCWYAMYVTVKLVTADQSTGNWILGVEFCINLWHAFQIIWIHNKVHGDVTVEEIRKW